MKNWAPPPADLKSAIKELDDLRLLMIRERHKWAQCVAAIFFLKQEINELKGEGKKKKVYRKRTMY